ncbi:MAG: thioesterase family protein [Desulfobacter sp.]|nr:thioesterase family protein [Desulfobacter sp.]
MAGGIKNTAAIITANYMDRCLHCPTRIQVSSLGESTHFIRKQASIVQDGRERIRAMGTFVRPSQIDFPSDYDGVPEDVAPWDRCIKVPSMPGYSLFDQVDLRLDPEYAGWMEGNLAQRSVMKGWVRFKDPRAVDLEALTLFADSFPPCVLARHGLVAWVPTIEYSVNIRELPSSDRLKGIFTTRFISSGLVEEDGELWDENGRLVALSRQIAKFHPQ